MKLSTFCIRAMFVTGGSIHISEIINVEDYYVIEV